MPMSNEPPFRLGLIGAGAATSIIHMQGVLASPMVAVTAIVDPVVARAQALARDYGISPKIDADVSAVLPDVDGLMIVTPNHTHRDIAVTCLRAGVPCLVEKPLSISVAEAEDMCRAAEEKGLVLAVGYTTRFRDEVVLLKELLDSGYFGALRRFHYQEGKPGGWSAVSGFMTDRKASGGGVLVGTGTHFMDRMLYWFGYPNSCSLMDDSRGGPEAHCLARFQYKNALGTFEGTLLLSKLASLTAGLVIETERGDLINPMGMGRSPLYFRARGEKRHTSILCPAAPRRFTLSKNDTQLEVENFVKACRGKEPPLVDGRQGLLSMRLLQALYQHRSPMSEPWTAQEGMAAE